MRAGLAACGAACVLASSAFGLSRGTSGADFLKIANGVRAVGMGSTYTALGEDVYSVYWNPAGLAQLDAPEAAFSYVKLYQSAQIEGVYLVTAAAEFPRFPLRAGNFGAGVVALSTGSFDSTDPRALVRAAAGSASDLMAFTTFSVPLSETFSIGGSTKLIRRSLTGPDPASYQLDPLTGDLVPTRAIGYQAAGAGADLGVLWRNLDRTLSVGASVQNLGTMGRFGEGFNLDLGGGDVLPTTFRAGASLRTALWGQALLLTGDVSTFVDALVKPRLSLGAEYGVLGVAFLRAGWEQPLDQPIGRTALDFGRTEGLAKLPSPLRTGLGFRWRMGASALLQFDYALAPFGTLGTVHHGAMLVRWNIPRVPTAVTSEAPAEVRTTAAKRPAFVIEPKLVKFKEPPKRITVEITDDRGRVVKRFEGTEAEVKRLQWDGTDERGRLITGITKFNVRIKAIDAQGREFRAGTADIPTVTAEPQLKPVSGRPLYPEVTFVLPQGNYQLWQLQIQDAGRIVRTWEGTGQPKSPLVWDGRDESGRVPVLQAPRYAYAFTDEGGNVTRNEAPLPQVEADIKPEVTGNRVRIVGIRYRGRAVGLTEDHREVLARAAKFIARHPESTLTLEGYADVPGDDEANFEIAKERAERVLRSLLSDHGLAATRVSVRVYGRSRNAPRYDSIPEEEQNQRVDLVIHVRR